MLKETRAQRNLNNARKHLNSSTDLELVILVSEHDLEVRFWNSDDPPVAVDWDHSQYGGPQIFYKDPDGGVYANPIKVDFDEEDKELAFETSQKYKQTKNNNIIQQLVEAGEGGEEDDSLESMMKLNVLFTMLLLGVVGYMVM